MKSVLLSLLLLLFIHLLLSCFFSLLSTSLSILYHLWSLSHRVTLLPYHISHCCLKSTLGVKVYPPWTLISLVSPLTFIIFGSRTLKTCYYVHTILDHFFNWPRYHYTMSLFIALFLFWSLFCLVLYAYSSYFVVSVCMV